MLSVVLFFGILINSFSQTATPTPTAAVVPATQDFFAGKWDMIVVGTPNGDTKMMMTLTRKDGKLIGNLTPLDDTKAEKISLTGVEEEATKITIYFSASGYDVNVSLEKVDNNNLKGQLMNMFETKAKRISDTDFFAGKWDIMIFGTPRGDAKFITNLVRKDGKLTGELVNPDDATEKRPITKVEDSATKLVIYFMSSQGSEISIDLDKVDADSLKGSLMSYETRAKRIK